MSIGSVALGRPILALAVVVAALLMAMPAASSGLGPRHAHRHHRHARPRHRTWYVSAAAASAGNGSRRAPFDSLAAVEQVSRPGDQIVILPSPLPLSGGIALRARQTLRGGGPSVLGGSHPSGLPRIENTGTAESGDAVRLASGDTVENLVVGPSVRGGIYGDGVNHVTIAGNNLSATNSSCTTGFVVQPFKLPTLVPGVAIPFSAGLPNGWATIMVDESRGASSVRVVRNYVHDGGCADGIDVRASGTARVSATVNGNTLTRLSEGAEQQSVLAIGMQTIGTSTLDAQLSGNTETYIGSAILGDLGFADSEGLFANSAGRSQLTEHVEHNTFAHGQGHLSANCFEVAASNGGPTMNVTLADSTCDHVVGDILEAVNLSQDATMHFTADDVTAENSEFIAGPAFHQVEPGDDGDCLFELAAGAHSTTTVDIDKSLFAGCVTDGLEVAASVDDGTGPVNTLGFDVHDSRIIDNTLSNLRVATSSPVTHLDGRIDHTDLSGTTATPIILENVNTAGGTNAKLDLGGGSLGSPGDNCISTGAGSLVLDALDPLSARNDWWGGPGGPGVGQVVAVGGTVDAGDPLSRAPAGVC